MANVFMCHLEEKLTRDGLIPHLYRRYVDDTLARMPNTDAATMFLATLNGLHPSLSFTMELSVDDRIPFIGIEIIKNGTKLETQVYRKPTNTGLLLNFHSNTDKRYKDSLLKTMLHWLQRLLKKNVPNCTPFLDGRYIGHTNHAPQFCPADTLFLVPSPQTVIKSSLHLGSFVSKRFLFIFIRILSIFLEFSTSKFRGNI